MKTREQDHAGGRNVVSKPESTEPNSPRASAQSDGIFEKSLAILRREFPPGEPGAAADQSSVPRPSPAVSPDPLPARMLNEFVYCPRLFYYEHVEGVFVDNADTVRGSVQHRRVDAGKGDLPPAGEQRNEAAPDVIHSRSVTMGSERWGVVAKMDLVEVRNAPGQGETGDLFARLEVTPVDYKAGAPRDGGDVNEIWDADRMQLGVQMLLLRENGYLCREGVIYYRATKQRVRLPWTAELEKGIGNNIEAARRCAVGPIPPPLENSPKCVRCSLAPVCLPDETRLLARLKTEAAGDEEEDAGSFHAPSDAAPRRLIAARDDLRGLYLNTPGLRIGRSGETLQIKEKDKVLDTVRMSDINHVALFGNIQLSTQAVQGLCYAGIPVTYFSMGGWFYGLTRGHELKNVFLRIEQFRLARDAGRCLELARRFVSGKIRNHRTMLRRNHVEPPAPTLKRLRQAARDALSAESLASLLGIEGAAAALYFEHLPGLIKVAQPEEADARAQEQWTFDFKTRTRRPPTDPVNALLSLAYSLLAKDCVIACYAVGFDPYVGFFHQPRFGRPALALDLMEEFRPLIAESAVLTAINNRVVTEKDFVRAGHAVNLSPPGRKKFFQTYEQRMNHVLTHPVFDYKISYRRALELQARLLARVLTGEIPEYVPLMTR